MTEETLLLLFSFIAFLFAISVHESAHALSASWCGDPTARALGRVSLNPIRHIELFGTIIVPLMTALSGLPTFGWAKPTPVNLQRLRRPRRDDILVSVAGPVSNLLTAGLCLALLQAIRLSGEGAQLVDALALKGSAGLHGSILNPLATLLYRLLWINVVLGIFNLLPVPPLDGSHIVHQLLPVRMKGWYRSAGRYGFLLLLVAFWYTSIDEWIFEHPMQLFNSLLRM